MQQGDQALQRPVLSAAHAVPVNQASALTSAPPVDINTLLLHAWFTCGVSISEESMRGWVPDQGKAERGRGKMEERSSSERTVEDN